MGGHVIFSHYQYFDELLDAAVRARLTDPWSVHCAWRGRCVVRAWRCAADASRVALLGGGAGSARAPAPGRQRTTRVFSKP
jgi:hypothetical protein